MIVKRAGALETGAFYTLALFFLFLFGFPFVLTFFMSFKSMPEYMAGNFWGLPKTVYFGNFRRVLAANFLVFFRNSVVVSSFAVFLTTLFASLAGYAFAKLKFRLSGLIFTLIIAGMMIPIHTTLIPIYQMNKFLRFTNTFAGLVGPYISFGLPVAIYIITSFFREVPNSLQESAHIDGASSFRIYFSIMLPISAPAISTSSILNFLSYWNEFIVAMTMLNSTNKHTLPLGMRQFYGTENVNIPAVLTAVLVGSLPVIIFYMFAQERVINGLSAGAVKG
ncbi:MAG: carbohydrate ABC transporter permease [Treponema sp.]|jgi:raffinose/stachyose/melibiose transport system permease protein|nr:carbohydrate ABC transporter permease [Treponema sp.]